MTHSEACQHGSLGWYKAHACIRKHGERAADGSAIKRGESSTCTSGEGEAEEGDQVEGEEPERIRAASTCARAVGAPDFP